MGTKLTEKLISVFEGKDCNWRDQNDTRRVK